VLGAVIHMTIGAMYGAVFKGGTLHVAGRVAVVVGTTLSAANQGSVIASGDGPRSPGCGWP